MTAFASFLMALALGCNAWAQLPNKQGSFRFAAVGDTGTGGRAQYEIGAQLTEFRKTVSFDTVIMLGDNLYGSEKPKDFKAKFELPYKPLLDSGVKFFAVLGNHDTPSQQFYEPFNMGGQRYYTFQPRQGIRFFALDTNRMDGPQIAWLERELGRAGGDWKIVYFHHPLYSSGGRHGSNPALRAKLEPLFVEYGVAAALAGHDHFYERIKPQKGVHHFVVGGSAKLRSGNVRPTALTARAFDRDNSFLMLEIEGDTLHFQAISRTGETVDTGAIPRPAGRRSVSANGGRAAAHGGGGSEQDSARISSRRTRERVRQGLSPLPAGRRRAG